MIKTLKSRRKLEKLLHKLNDVGTYPAVALLTSGRYPRVVLAYGIDQGDTMATAFMQDPGGDPIEDHARLDLALLRDDEFPVVALFDGQSGDIGHE